MLLNKLSIGGADLIAVFVGLLLILATFFVGLDFDIRGDLWRVFLQPLPARADLHLVMMMVSLVLMRFLIARGAIACKSLGGGRHYAD